MECSHRKLVDSFYQSDGNDKIRVTRDEDTGTVLETMKKIRLGDLNIYSPKNMADWRISVNLEVPGACYLCIHMWTRFLTRSSSAPSSRYDFAYKAKEQNDLRTRRIQNRLDPSYHNNVSECSCRFSIFLASSIDHDLYFLASSPSRIRD